MAEKDIERARETIIENVDRLVSEIDEARGNFIESATRIYNLCNEATEYSWRDCIEKIQDIAREFTP